MKVVCAIGMMDTFKTPRYETVAKWHARKLGMLVRGQWPRPLPDYLSMTEGFELPENPYEVVGVETDTDFFEEPEVEDDDA